MKYQSFFVSLFLLVFLSYGDVFAFSDTKNSPFLPAIQSLAEQGVVKGFEDGWFHPELKVNRIDALKMIFTAFKVEVPDFTGWSGFSDVPADAWFTKFVVRAKQLGIIKGTKKQVFSPAGQLTYAEALKIIFKLNAVKIPESVENPPFPDVPANSWFAPYFVSVKNLKIIDGNSGENVFPEKILNRGEFAQLLFQSQKVFGTEEREIGMATFYRTKFERNNPDDQTSAGAFTTAHKTLPFGTKLKITALDSGKTVIVTVSDRGPYGAGRIVDLSRTAFSAIAPLSQGIAPVLVEIIK